MQAGLIGGGTRSTLGAFGERSPEIDDTTPGPEGQVGQDTQTTPPVEPEQLELGLDDPLLRPQLREGQEQGELFTAANAAQEKEVENAADPTSPKGKAEQTDEQRAAASAVVAGTNVTSDVALDKEQTNLVNEQTRKQKKADAKAVAKTQDYLPGLEPQESGAAAIESEQTGQKIEVGKKDVETTETTEEAFTPDYVKNVLGVTRPAAPLLIAATKGNLSGKSLDDPAVVKRLANYVGNRGAESNAVIASMEERGFKYDEANKQFIRPESGAVGTSVSDSKPSVDGEGGDGSRVESAIKPVSSESESVGAGVRDTVSSDVAAREQSDTLEKTPDAQGIEAVKQLAEKTTATPVTKDLADAEYAQYIRQNPLSAEAQAEAEKRRVIRETPGGYENLVRNALAATGTTVPPEVLVEQDELAARQAKLAEGQPKGLEVPTGPMTGAISGRKTATDANFVPVPEAVRVPDAPEVQGASVSQEQLQAVEAERNAAAQARIDRIFENNRGKQPQVREYHDTQVDPRSAPEVTTAVDKEGILELLETSDDNLKGDANASARAAKLFFKRFRRPVDALAEIGAIRVDGPTQSIEKDYTPVQFAFYKGMTQGNATQASLWVNNNLSRQARNEVRDAKIAARIDPNDNRSDAYLGVVKAAKSIQRKDNEALQKQMDRELDALKLEAQTRSPAELDQAQRGEGVVGAIKPIKGQTAFDSLYGRAWI